VDKLARMALLYDFYSSLLTPKQRESLDLYYQQDFSLGEIAEESGISRQAVHDLLKRTEKILLEYEKKLGLVELHLERKQGFQEIISLLDRTTADSALLARVKQIVLELSDKD